MGDAGAPVLASPPPPPPQPRQCRLQRRCSAPRLPGTALQAGGALGSSLRCHWLFDQYPELHCTGANLALDLAKFAVRGCGGGWLVGGLRWRSLA